MYIRRLLEKHLLNLEQQFSILLLTGPRQVGKTTLLQHISSNKRHYVTLDDPALALLAKEEPQLFLQRFSPPLILDEIQYAPELFRYLKMVVDQRQQAGDYWLTGSQQFHLMKGISESLAGRVGLLKILGLSLKEIQGIEIPEPFIPDPSQLRIRSKHSPQLDLKTIYKIIWRGAFPKLQDPSIDRDLFYSSYIQTYLERDVRALANVGDTHQFLKFLRACAARTASLLNMSELARDIGISTTTAKNWLSILEASGIIYLLEPFHTNLTKRLIKAPKLHFLDTGLCAYLTGWSSPETLEAGAMSGAIFESFVFSEILKSYWHNAKQATVYYYRDKDMKEIDLLIIRDDIIYPIEIKKTANPTKSMVKSFDTLNRLKMRIGDGGLICLLQQDLPLSEKVNAIPVGFL